MEEKRSEVAPHLFSALFVVERLKVARQDVLVVLLLNGGELDPHQEFRLGRHVLAVGGTRLGKTLTTPAQHITALLWISSSVLSNYLLVSDVSEICKKKLTLSG